MNKETQNLHLTDEQLFDLLDGNCSNEEAISYKFHLGNCSSCHAIWMEYQALDSQLSSLVMEKAPDYFVEKVIEKWQITNTATKEWTYYRTNWFMWGMMGLLGLFFILIGYFILTTKAISTTSYIEQVLPDVSTLIGLTTIMQQEWIWKGFLIINGLLALLLFDKVLLKPFFEKKRQALAN